MALNLPYSNEEFLRIVKLAEGVSNRNLLDNWYFADPINQRGQTEYTGTVYTVDRWKLGHSILSAGLETDGIRITANSAISTSAVRGFHQFIENPELLSGKTVTLSALTGEKTGSKMYLAFRCVSGGSVKSFEKYGAASDSLWSNTVTLPDDITELLVGVSWAVGTAANDNILLRKMKLEIGEHSTLENDDPPSKAEELAKCQRFFQRYRTQSLRPAYADDCRPVMRAEPTVGTITADGTTYYTLSADL